MKGGREGGGKRVGRGRREGEREREGRGRREGEREREGRGRREGGREREGRGRREGWRHSYPIALPEGLCPQGNGISEESYEYCSPVCKGLKYHMHMMTKNSNFRVVSMETPT